MSRIVKWYMVVTACLFFAACAPNADHPDEPVDQEQALRDRAAAWNQARIEQDFLAAYELIWSGFKEVVPLRDFLNRRTGFGKINEYIVEDVRITDDDQALVALRTNFDAFGYALEGRGEEQVWVLERGQWHIRIEPVISTPFGPIPIQDFVGQTPVEQNPEDQ